MDSDPFPLADSGFLLMNCKFTQCDTLPRVIFWTVMFPRGCRVMLSHRVEMGQGDKTHGVWSAQEEPS